MLSHIFIKAMRDRWLSTCIVSAVVGLALLSSMATYRDIDLGFYAELPDAFRALANIPAGVDVGGLAYGAVYSFVGAIALAGLALSIGAAAIAGEERAGTLGLLLGNPRSRTQVLVAKAGAMVTLTTLGALVLLGIGYAAPALLDVGIEGYDVFALVFHLWAIALFFGFFALMIGAATGNAGRASGASIALMALSYLAVGILPLVPGAGELARVFPWYYYDSGQPLNNGVSWAHIVVLLGLSAAFAVVAWAGFNRRDLRGRSVGVTLLDRLRANRLTGPIVERLAGSARVSSIFVKTGTDYQGVLIIAVSALFWTAVAIGPLYAVIGDDLATLSAQLPKALMQIVGGGDMSTAAGWYQVELMGLMGPIVVIVVTMMIGTQALAGEEGRRTLGLLLANPVTRTRVLLEKAAVMVAYAAVVGVAAFVGASLGSLIGSLGMNLSSLAATVTLMSLVGLVFGALALTIGAATGSTKAATFGAAGAAGVLFLLNSFLPLSDSLAELARISPFYYFLGSDPMVNGMNWGHAAVLVGIIVVLAIVAGVAFNRRDLRRG